MTAPAPPFPPNSTGRPRLWGLVPCAGLGSRAGTPGPKQYQPLAGQAMVSHTLQALARVQALEAVLLVLAPGDTGLGVPLPARFFAASCGGSTRAESVLGGLVQLQGRGAVPDDWVLVHDAARCLVLPSDVERLVAACLSDGVGGLLALPLNDTLKTEATATASGPASAHAQAMARASGTVSRTGKWLAQTPQMFRLGLLRQALERARETHFADITDEASAIEALGHQPLLVQGHSTNIKLTYPADFALAEALLHHRKTQP